MKDLKFIIAGILGLLFGVPLVGWVIWGMFHGQASISITNIIGTLILSLIPILGARFLVLTFRDHRAVGKNPGHRP
jgi:type IV secretory pathway VirB3-like protein